MSGLESGTGNQSLNIGMGTEMAALQTLSIDPIAIIHAYQAANPKVFQIQTRRVLDALTAKNADGTPNKENSIVMDWGGASGDGDSLGILATRKFIDALLVEDRGFPAPFWAYHHVMTDVIITRKMGLVTSPQGEIPLEEYQRVAPVTAELGDLTLRFLPGISRRGDNLIYVRDHIMETEMYDQGLITGTPRGNVQYFRWLVANMPGRVFKYSVNAPEKVNFDAMSLREVITSLPDNRVAAYLRTRGVIDTRTPAEIKKSYRECGNRQTMLQQYKDWVDNAFKYIRRHGQTTEFSGFELSIGDWQTLFEADPTEWQRLWADFISDKGRRDRWDEFVNQYLRVWQKLVYGDNSDDIHGAVVLTPDQLPIDAYRVEDREWFTERDVTRLLVQEADKSGNDILVGRLRTLKLMPQRKKFYPIP